MIFVDKQEDLENFDAAEYFDTPSELLGNQSNRLRKSQVATAQIVKHKEELNQLKKREYNKFSNKIEQNAKLNSLVMQIDKDKQLLVNFKGFS